MRACFISYATSDRRKALAVCEALEQSGIPSWIACRDVQLGENYQEAIVRALRAARAVVLVFSHRANASDEIKKELSLASRHRIPVMTLRVEDVEPSDAFAYELATRQWIDLFADRDGAMATLVQRIEAIDPGDGDAGLAARPASLARSRPLWRRPVPLVAGAAVLATAGAGWLLLRPSPVAGKTMTVRLTAFDRLSPNMPASLAAGLKDEVGAAFSNDGLVNVSNAAAAPPGDAPAYALGGTVRRDGDTIRVVARLTNERTGVDLWSNGFAYPAAKVDAVPRQVALNLERIARCGLFGASTYPKPLPDPVLIDYFQYCQNAQLDDEPTKALDFAKRTVAAAPDFSWGWSAITVAAATAVNYKRDLGTADALRREGLAAAARALDIDPSNSEALAFQAQLINQNDLVARDALLKRAVSARPLACGCEHHLYGYLLEEVGRENDAAHEFQRAADIWSLEANGQESLGEALLLTNHPAAAKPHFDAAFEIDDDPAARARVMTLLAPASRDYAGAIASLGRASELQPNLRDAWIEAFRALASGSAAAKSAAAAKLVALQSTAGRARMTANLLGALGHDDEALKLIAPAVETAATGGGFSHRNWLFYPTLRGTWHDRAFASLIARLGLLHYWQATHTKPDMCGAADPPPLCKLL